MEEKSRIRLFGAGIRRNPTTYGYFAVEIAKSQGGIDHLPA
jgi:hypothetical protein